AILPAEAVEPEEALRRGRRAREAGVEAALGLAGVDDPGTLLRRYRVLAETGGDFPIHLRAPKARDERRQVVDSSILLGSLLCDGIGDSVEIDSNLGPERGLELLYNILQGAGARLSKAEFISCPGCGRTRFDLAAVAAAVKRELGHLKGLKIAVMGCVVNGPGEMADADFGYVGGAPGQVNLYVGKACVCKGIPSQEAIPALVGLIKAEGKWINKGVGRQPLT
ncbi:MAG: flavodoxin-dependent (E)-4-hydroxy-3-methylbut-2-enyl-diphosphate synthase, partial [Elusimicrobia bacterium]|nr:flavodoxin-dependent (E)-4-hydroxy-3-methylbut-2-enyl-diphosphate synthase [Elusimicrobiota bacterium]